MSYTALVIDGPMAGQVYVTEKPYLEFAERPALLFSATGAIQPEALKIEKKHYYLHRVPGIPYCVLSLNDHYTSEQIIHRLWAMAAGQKDMAGAYHVTPKAAQHG